MTGILTSSMFGAQVRWLRQVVTNKTLVIAYLEARTKAGQHGATRLYNDKPIVEIIEGVCGVFSSNQTEVVLASHSGGGSLIFGYMNAVERIPASIKRIFVLDSDYDYGSKLDAQKTKNWLKASDENHLCGWYTRIIWGT